jgi:hypothetical protein
VQVAVTVKPLLSPLLSPAHPFVVKGCRRSDRSDSGKQNFQVVFCFRVLPCTFHFPRDVFGKRERNLAILVDYAGAYSRSRLTRLIMYNSHLLLIRMVFIKEFTFLLSRLIYPFYPLLCFLL